MLVESFSNSLLFAFKTYPLVLGLISFSASGMKSLILDGIFLFSLLGYGQGCNLGQRQLSSVNSFLGVKLSGGYFLVLYELTRG